MISLDIGNEPLKLESMKHQTSKIGRKGTN